MAATEPQEHQEPQAPLTSLSEVAQTVLAALAVVPAGLARTTLLNVVQAYGLQIIDGKRPDDLGVKALLADLRKLGWLAPATDNPRQPSQVQPGLRNRVLSWIVHRPEAQAWLQRMVPPLQLASTWDSAARAWVALLLGHTQEALGFLHGLMANTRTGEASATHPVPLLLADDVGQQMFAAWPALTRAALLADWLQGANYFLFAGAATDTAWQAAMALCETAALQQAAPVRAELGVQVLLQALLRGEVAMVQQLGERLPEVQDLAAFLLALGQGQPSAARAAFDLWQQRLRKLTGKLTNKRKVALPRLLEILHWLALLGEGSVESLATLARALAADKSATSGPRLLQHVVLTLQGRDALHTPQALGVLVQRAQLQTLDSWLVALTMHWLAGKTSVRNLNTLRSECAHWQEQGYVWLAAEFAAIAVQQGQSEQSSAELADWHDARGWRPLLALYQRREPWQHALAALAALTAARGAVEQPAQPARRLAWWLSWGGGRSDGAALKDVGVEPREQKCNAKGQWSRGRPVALQRLLQQPDDFDYLLDADRAVVATIRQEYVDYYGNPRWFIPVQAALPLLVGHPHLYRAEAPDVRVDLSAGQASLHLEEKKGQIHLRLQPPEVVGHGYSVLVAQTPTALIFYPPDANVARVGEVVGRGLSVPLAARAQLVEAIAAIAPMLPVHSDIPELAGHMASVAGDATLYAHLLPLSEGLRLQLLVRPQAGGAWLRPGQGAASLVGEEDGQPVQIRRDLADERARLAAVLEHCPALGQGENDGHEWRFDSAEDALQLLAELHALDAGQGDGQGDEQGTGGVVCVWPEGERMRIRARPGMGSLRLSVQRQGDWFALQGEVALDDGRVLQLKQLLDLMAASPRGRFVPLGEGDWLALSTDLRRRLADVAHLADKIDDKGARLSALNAPLLEALEAEAAEFRADAAWQAQRERLQSLRSFNPSTPKLLAADLRDYQRAGFVWLARLAQWGVGACLADDMGLGKTVQLLALLLHRANLGAQLVVAPTSVVANWQGEALRFAPSLRLLDYRQTRSLENLGAGDLVLVSYGLLQSDHAAFAAQHWTTAVLDEAQAVKNAQTKRSHAVMALQADFRVIATGTPLENHLGELWNLMRFINPGLLGSQQRFAERFAVPIEAGDGAAQAQARRALKQLIQPFLLRRLKSAVLDELPARTDITHTIALSDDERHQYEALRQQAVAALVGSEKPDNPGGGDARFKALAQITRLRRFCCHPSLVLPGSPLASSKLQALQHIVAELRDNGHRALVFSQFVDHLTLVRRWLDEANIDYQYLDGATPPKARSTAVAAFQAGAGDVFLISLKAGGSGLNLTAADYVIHLDPWWNPAVEDQASDRAHRIGQQRPVTVYRLVAENTIEEKIVALHAQKRDLADTLLEGGQASARLDAEALLALIRQG